MFGHRIRRAEPLEAKRTDEGSSPDRDLFAVLALFWAISLTRVAIGLVHHETFGAEGTLAFLAVLLVPWLVKDARASLYLPPSQRPPLARIVRRR